MTDQEIVDAINEMYPPASVGYNVAFIVDGKPMVTSESFTSDPIERVVDYYHYDRPTGVNGYCTTADIYDEHGVSRKLKAWLSSHGLWAEWEHAGGVHIYRKESQ